MCVLVLVACMSKAASQLSCDNAKRALRGSGLVVDLPGCAIAEKVAKECTSCRTALCARWEIENANPEPYPEADPTASASDYQRHFSQKVRRVSLGDVPSLHQESLDFLLIKHFQVESPVDQQAEISSLVGMAWGLVRPGGVLGILSNKGQTIVLINPDGEMFLAYADYPGTLQQAAQETGLGSVNALTCPWDEVSEQAVLAVRPLQETMHGASPAQLLSKHISQIYVIESAEGRHRGQTEKLLFGEWGLPKDMVTFQTPCNGKHDSLRKDAGACLATTARIGNKEEACITRGLLLSLQDIIDEARPASLIIQDMYTPDKDDASLEADWGVLCASKPEQCESGDGTRSRTSQHMLPAGLSFGAALWSLRAARSLVKTMDERCTPLDDEVERQLAVHNISVSSSDPSFASPIKYHGDEPPQRVPATAQAGGGVGGGARPTSPLHGIPCRVFSFFDCHAEYSWDDCVAKRDECGGSH
eukprot:CAMPEP_0206261334 /NCGR_PEP_ID=MMETSP0047_2-20121206/27594_1 /ASSEMBLY_ACC=CAM_ASM_000192 /TAXON_ID=195065 /ORGANISM="Chroomonas mesostigmatica_cf, Strain CCMP1168" /LENGTH=474 /DNA_ID=CAMNT_0053688531 /DNA_START=110 /DNA_END=1535 /DNA_ORIENTATION=-